ncbi:MAG: extracellular solute-binding protein [Nannocystaceae bacterium]|nr:extracellular solute-binding protein [Nannocystaceae bacterium]
MLHGSRLWLRTLWLAALFLLWVRPAAAAEPITVWHAYRGEEEAALLRAVAAFREGAHSRGEDVNFSTLALPYDAFASKISAAVPLGDGPHVFIDSHERLGDYRKREVVAPVGDALEAGAFLPAALEAVTLDAHVYAVPLNLKSLALYVNTELAAVPDTFEDIVAAADGLPIGVHALAYEAMNPYAHAPLLHAFGGTMLGEGDTFGMVGPQAEASVAFAHALVEAGVVPSDADGALVTSLFRSGKAAYAMSGPWLASDLKGGVPYRVVPLPPLAQTGRRLAPFLTVEAVMLSPKGAASSVARSLARHLAGADAAFDRQDSAQVPSARVDVPSADALLSAFTTQANTAVPMPTSAAMRSTWEPARQALRKVLRGQAEPGAALTEAQRRFRDVRRPPPPPASPWPAMVLSALSLVGALVWVSRARRANQGPSLRESAHAYRYLAHAVLAVGVLVILPLSVGAGTSLFAGPSTDMHYVGLGNFGEILTARGGELLGSGSFYLVLLVTLLWTVINVVFHLGIGLAIGLLLSRPILKMKAVYRVLLIVPWAVPNYVTALAWKGMFHRQFGAVTGMINAINDLLGTSLEPISWFAQFSTAFTANIATNVWLGFPFMMVVTIGALTSVPKDVLEAAEVDGASRWQRLTRVTLPIIRPTLMPAVTLGAIWTFNMFNVVFLVSGGDPDSSTDILVSDAYRWAFTREAQYGYAAAYAVLIFLLLFFGTKILDRWKARWSGSGRGGATE